MDQTHEKHLSEFSSLQSEQPDLFWILTLIGTNNMVDMLKEEEISLYMFLCEKSLNKP